MWVIIIIEAFLYLYNASALENLALGKPVWEDRPWQGPKKYGAKNAVDGRYDDRSYRSGQCVRSGEKAQTATWGVDLGGVVSISHINIYSRTENKSKSTSNASRISGQMAGFFLYVSNTTSKEDGHLCFHVIQTVEGTPSEDQRINCSVLGRYVIYYNERLPNVNYPSYYTKYAFYELCELEVYGCSITGFYGSNCSISCPKNCQERRCDVNRGHCLGCVPGYQGVDCSEVCSPKTYGQDCVQSCGNCSNIETCNHVNGMCLHGCKEGVQGRECKTECTVGQYGKDCKFQCSENCNVTRGCSRFTGECDGGCKAGWTGSRCNQKCSSGSFGINCLYKCNVYCTGNETCDHVTGVCDEGCKTGWNTPLCNKGKLQDILSGFDNIIVWISIAASVVIVIIGCVLSCVCCKSRKVSIVVERHVQQLSTECTEEEKDAAQYEDLQEVGGYDNLKSQMYSN